MTDAVQIARAAASAAGRLVRSRADDVGAVRSKSSATDIVTQSDIDAGVEAVRTIAEHDPTARFVVEEPEVYELAGVSAGSVDERRVWVIDPIDGTTSFLHGFPCFSVSVALLEDGVSVAGAVYNAALDEMSYAGRGQGAFRDGKPIRVSGVTQLDQSLLVTGFPYDRGALLDRQIAVLTAFLRAPVHGMRRDGSSAVDCCHVASGRCDGFWEHGLKVWDLAAGVLICREAGARVTDVEGREWDAASTSICAANPHLHERMLEVIARGAQDWREASPAPSD